MSRPAQPPARRRPMIVAFEEIEGPQSRLLRQMIGGLEAVTDSERRRPPGRGRYWCAADKPTDAEGDGDFRLRAVYRTNPVPADARCEQCGIAIAELQDAMKGMS